LHFPRFFLRFTRLASCASLMVAACTTTDPRPGLGDGGSTNPGFGSGGGWGANAGGSSSGGTHFGDGGAGGADPGTSDRQCGDSPALDQPFTKKRLLESAGLCSAYHICLFSNTVSELGRRVTDYAEDASDLHLTRARSAWVHAMTAWALSAPAQYGPVASVASDKYYGRGIGSF